MKAAKNLTNNRVGDLGAAFAVQERITIKMLNGLNN